MKNRIKSDKFSLEEYKRILKKAERLGYKFPKLSGYKEWIDKYPKFLLLRHDIEASPFDALKMAEVEYSLGITSTYYTLMHTIFYNPAAPPYFDVFKKMLDMGHEIGLHYDCSFFSDRHMNPQKGIREDVKALESILGIKVKTISQHKPASHGRLRSNTSLPYIRAYSDDLMSKVIYISDSGFKWRNRTLVDLIGNFSKIYAAIHPSVWSYSNFDMEQTYSQASEMAQGLVRREFSDFIKSVNEYLKQRQAQKIK